jgi:hypothetical protein
LPLCRKKEEVADYRPQTATRAAVTGPGTSPGDIHVVVDRDLLAGFHHAASDQVARVGLVVEIRVGITRMVEVTTREPDQHDLAVRIIAMVEPLAKLFPERRVVGDFADDVDPMDAFAVFKTTTGEEL